MTIVHIWGLAWNGGGRPQTGFIVSAQQLAARHIVDSVMSTDAVRGPTRSSSPGARQIWADAQRPRLCVPETPSEGDVDLGLRLAVIVMTKRPSNFITWLTYHREVIGAMHFFIRIEDTPALAEYLSTPPWNSLCTVTAAESCVRDWKEQSQRQFNHTAASITAAKGLGVTHVLHIDDDELLYLPSGIQPLRAAISHASSTNGCVELHALNLEALAPMIQCTNPFAECCAFRHMPDDFDSYGRAELCHGKSIGIVNGPVPLHPYSPHHFKGPGPVPERLAAPDAILPRSLMLPPPTAVILHYESCSYRRWRDKFSDYAWRFRHHGRRAIALAASFSPFYRQSIAACARLLGFEAEADALGLRVLPPKWPTAATGGHDAEDAARAVWSRSKLEPPEVSASRPVAHMRTLGRLTLIPPPAAAVASGETTAAAERALEAAMGRAAAGKTGYASTA